MTTLRLRVLKRHTSVEMPFEEFFKTELLDRQGQTDVNLSVFDIDTDGLVRTHAEYVVSFLQPAPNKKRGGLFLDDCQGDFDATPVEAVEIVFDYARTHHVELRFLREEEVRALAAQVYREHATRECSASAKDVFAYGKGRLDARDNEWIIACQERPKWKKALQR